jgi:hypothetical protein
MIWTNELEGLSSGLYFKHVTIVYYTSSNVNKLKASLNDDARVIIYDCHMFIVQATGANVINFFCPQFTNFHNKLECLSLASLV